MKGNKISFKVVKDDDAVVFKGAINKDGSLNVNAQDMLNGIEPDQVFTFIKAGKQNNFCGC